MKNTSEIEKIIRELKEKGFTQIETIKFLMKNKKTTLKEADVLVLESEAWKEEKNSTNKLRDLFLDTLENYQYFNEIDEKIEFIEKYFGLFKAKIENTKEEKGEIKGFLSWKNEENVQEFCWKHLNLNIDLENTGKLIRFLIDNNMVEIDKIRIDRNILLDILERNNWKREKIEEAINDLCSIRVAMVDEGQKTDYFFIHF